MNWKEIGGILAFIAAVIVIMLVLVSSVGCRSKYRSGYFDINKQHRHAGDGKQHENHDSR